MELQSVNKIKIEEVPDAEMQEQVFSKNANGRCNDKTMGESLGVDGFLELVGGFGRFQWLLLVFFISMHISPVAQIYITYFTAIDPDWKCVEDSKVCLLNGTFASTNEYRCKIPRTEWEFTQPKSKTIVVQYDLHCKTSWLIYMTSSIFYIGKLFGSFTSGWLADNYGRKTVLYPSFAGLLTFSLLSTTMPNIGLLLLCRFITGLFSDSSTNQMLTLLSESVTTKYRPLATNILWLGWIGTLCVLPLIAYFISEWKTLFIIFSAPFFIAMLSYFCVTESPRWLKTARRYEDCKNVFKKIARYNKQPFDESLQITRTETSMKRTTPLDLFKSKKIAIYTISQGFIWFVNGMVYYGISLAADELGGSFYLNWIYISVIEIPSAIMAIFCSNYLGRKTTTIIAMIIGGILCIIVPFVPSSGDHPAKVILGVLGKMFITLSYDVITIWSVEIFSTDIRSKGLSFVYIMANVGSSSSPWIAKALNVYSVYLPFAIMGGFAIIGGFVARTLPETRGQDAQDTID